MVDNRPRGPRDLQGLAARMDKEDLPSFPAIVEHKRTLDGRRKSFSCAVLDRAPDAVTVLYVSDRIYRVGGLELPIGTVTIGHFWMARPYNVYHWLAPHGVTRAHYFNLTTATVIEREQLAYLDLAVDVLARPGGVPAVLDADEVPRDLPPATRDLISHSLALVLATLPQVIADLEGRADQLWPRAFGAPRRAPRP